MTDQRLRELLQDRVDDLTTTDLSARAWQHARRSRRRRALGVVGVVTTALAVAGGVSVIGGGDRDADPAPPAPSRSVDDVGDTQYEGVPVWWGPNVEGEPGLPPLAGSPLPESLDLRTATEPVPQDVRALALIRAGGRVVVLADDHALYRLDVARLDPVTDEGGNVIPPLTGESLAPDGRHAFFVQEGALEVYDFAAASWTTIDTPRWHAESARWVSDTEIYVSAAGREPDGEGTTYDLEGTSSAARIAREPVWDVASDHPWGPQRGPARSYFVSLAASNMAVIVTDGGESAVLAMPLEWDTRDGPGRMKGCCPVVGWLDPDVVLFESRSTGGSRILAWRTGTREVSLVTDIHGLYAGASFADLSRPF